MQLMGSEIVNLALPTAGGGYFTYFLKKKMRGYMT